MSPNPPHPAEIRRQTLRALVAKYGQSIVAKRMGKPDRQIADILAGRKSFGEKVAATMEVNWGLATGEALDLLNGPEFILQEISAFSGNVHPGPDIKGLIPLLTSIQAGQWTEIAGSFQRQDARLWLPCPVKHGPLTFCLEVEGESMRNPGSKPSYDPGDIIFVDPDLGHSPGDRVVAALEGQEKATFKQYMEEDGRKMLKALNPDWKPRYIEINGNALICGVVIGKWVPE